MKKTATILSMFVLLFSPAVAQFDYYAVAFSIFDGQDLISRLDPDYKIIVSVDRAEPGQKTIEYEGFYNPNFGPLTGDFTFVTSETGVVFSWIIIEILAVHDADTMIIRMQSNRAEPHTQVLLSIIPFSPGYFEITDDTWVNKTEETRYAPIYISHTLPTGYRWTALTPELRKLRMLKDK